MRLLSVIWRYTKVNRYKIPAMHFIGLVSARSSCKYCHASFFVYDQTYLFVFNNCLLVWLLHLVIQLHVDLHVCKCLFTQLAFCFSVETLPSLLALDTLCSVVFFANRHSIHCFQDLRSGQTRHQCLLDCVCSGRRKFVNQSLISALRSDLLRVLSLRICLKCTSVCMCSIRAVLAMRTP